MNPLFIKSYISNNIGKKVDVQVFGLRNKIKKYSGIIDKIYPQIFTVRTPDGIKSISYSEIINREVKISIS